MDIIDPKSFENIGVFKGFKSLKYKLLIKVLTVSAAVTFFMTALSVYNDYIDEKKNFVSTLGKIEKVVVPSITEDVWMFDLVNIKKQLDLLMGMEEIVYSEVAIGNSDVIVPSYPAKVNDTTILYNYSLLKNGKVLGTIKLTTTMDFIYDRVQKRVFTFLWFQTIKTFLVSFLIVWVFQKYVVKYLEKIVVYLKDFQNISKNGILDVKSTNLKSVDELDILIASFNNLLAKLEKAEEKLLEDLQAQKSFSLNSAKMASVGEMAGGAAHEINNPLAIIDGQFHMLEVLYENGQLNKENFRKIANTCSNSILRISKILTSLQFLTQKQYSNKYEIVFIDHLLEMVTSLYRQRLKQHQIRLKINVHEDIKVCCTPQGIVEVLVNLMNNSLYEITQKQEDKNYVKNDEWISIAIVNKDENVDIVFSDSGRVLNEEERRKIFQPFYSTKPVGSGTGLSLSVSKKILEFNSGELKIDEEAENTTFIVTLPTKPTENKI